jgi:hypothetical protein
MLEGLMHVRPTITIFSQAHYTGRAGGHHAPLDAGLVTKNSENRQIAGRRNETHTARD